MHTNVRKAAARLVIAAAAVAMVAPVATGAASADSTQFGTATKVTLSGLPVSLVGNNGVPCTADTPTAPAHLSRPLTFTIDAVPTGLPALAVSLGYQAGFYLRITNPTAGTTVYTIPANGGGGSLGHFVCADADPEKNMRFGGEEQNAGGEATGGFDSSIKLTNVD